MLTIAPPLAVLIMAGMACLESRNMVSTLTCITRRYSSGFSSTTLPRLPMPTLLSRKSSRPAAVDGGLDQPLAFGLNGDVAGHRRGAATLGLDHFDRAPGKPRIEIGHHHLGAGARQQDRRSPAIADTVARSTPTADDRDLASQTGISSRSFMRASANCLSTVSPDKKCPETGTSAQFIKARRVDVGLGQKSGMGRYCHKTFRLARN